MFQFIINRGEYNAKFFYYCFLVWTLSLVGWTWIERYRPAVVPQGDSAAFVRYASEKMDTETVGNAAFTLICNYEVCGEHYVSRGFQVTRDTPFQVASLSKWISAWGVMTLVQSGQINLDAPVSDYVKSWKLPESKFDAKQVTVRRLLSHTAGLNDGLGYGGFLNENDVESLPASLTHASDTIIGRTGRVKVSKMPGNGFAYSGGGFTLLQLLIEDVTGETFDAYMRKTILGPLGMTNSGFLLNTSEEGRVAQSFETSGKLAQPRYYTATAAASLYTTTADLVKFLRANDLNKADQLPQKIPLNYATIASMRIPNATKFGIPIWGLGHTINYENNTGQLQLIGHDGGNMPAIRTTARLNPHTGNGIIILSSGQQDMSVSIWKEWTKWEIGRPRFLLFLYANLSRMMLWAFGVVVLLLAMFGFSFLQKLNRDKLAR